MKSDPGRIEADDLLAALEERIAEIYQQAVKETQEKLDDYLRRFAVKDEIKKKQLAAKKITKAEYDQWRKGQIMIGKRWEEMRDMLAQDYHNANTIARSVINGYMPEAYAIGHNYGTFEVEHGSLLDTSYTLYDRQTVERIIRDNPDLLPPPGRQMNARLAAGKDIRWQEGQLQSVVLQSILQGESIPSMAKRIADTMGETNHKATIRYARTAMTGAENAGRMDGYRRAQGMGIQMQKTWIATLDDRTRHGHRELDGQTADVDKPFENEIGKIMFPGDPSADGANIWNCRCTLISQIKGFERDVKDLNLRRDEKLGDMTYDEWKESRIENPLPITRQEKIGEAMRRRYVNEDYRK